MNGEIENRRIFLRRAALAAASFPFLLNCRTDTLGQKSGDLLDRIKQNAIRSNSEWSGAKDAPADVSWQAVLAGKTDPGEPLIISGTVFRPDGTTPAPNVLIYLYHTDAEGIYGRAGQHRHGRYRGWLLTDERGRYEFRTIKPASYPNSTVSSHIHMTITGTDFKEDWIDSILFEGDRFLTARERGSAGRKGGFDPIVKLDQGTDGILRGRRDIQLWKT